MAQVRDIISHVEIEIAEARRICHRNKQEHHIRKGEKCLAIYDDAGGRKNYCALCWPDILLKAKTRLLTMERELQN